MCDDFNDFDDLFDSIKEDIENDPGEVFDIGEEIDIDCPICKEETKGIIISRNKIKCEKCNTVMDLNVTVEFE